MWIITGLSYFAAMSQIGSRRGSSAWMNVPSGFFAPRPSGFDTFIPSAPALNARSISAANLCDQPGSLMPSALKVMKVATRSLYGAPAFKRGVEVRAGAAVEVGDGAHADVDPAARSARRRPPSW